MVSTTTQLSMPATGQTWSSVSSPVLSPRLLEVLEVMEVMEVMEVLEVLFHPHICHMFLHISLSPIAYHIGLYFSI